MVFLLTWSILEWIAWGRLASTTSTSPHAVRLVHYRARLSLYLVLVLLQLLTSIFMLARGRNIYVIAYSNIIRSKVLCLLMSVEVFYNFPSGQTTKNIFWNRYIMKKNLPVLQTLFSFWNVLYSLIGFQNKYSLHFQKLRWSILRNPFNRTTYPLVHTKARLGFL